MSDFITEDQRLVILRSLADYNGELGESVLQDCLDDYVTACPATPFILILPGLPSRGWCVSARSLMVISSLN